MQMLEYDQKKGTFAILDKYDYSDTDSDAYKRLDEILSGYAHQINCPYDDDGWTLLHYVCAQGYTDLCVLFLDHKADVTAKTKYGETALHLACRDLHESVVGLLLNQKYLLINEQDNRYGNTALHYACERALKKIVGMLLARGAEVSLKNKRGQTCLHTLCESIIYKKDPYYCNECKHFNNAISCELFCCEDREIEVKDILASLIKSLKADIDHQDDRKMSALHYAAQNGYTSLCKILFHENPALARFKNNEKLTPLHYACRGNYLDICETFLSKRNLLSLIHEKDNNGKSPLHYATLECKNLDLTKFLLDLVVRYKLSDQDNKTPLDYLITFKEFAEKPQRTLTFLEIFFRERGFHWKQKDYNNSPAKLLFYAACTSGSAEAAETLLQQRGDALNSSKIVNNGFCIAAKYGYTNVCKKLLKNVGKSILLSRSKEGWTPLHDAAFNGHLEVCKFFLLELAEQVKFDSSPFSFKNYYLLSQTKKGWTPLHCSAWNGHLEVCGFLLDQGASLYFETEDGHTPLHFASWRDNADICEEFVSRDKNILIVCDKYGWNALDHACYEEALTSLNSLTKMVVAEEMGLCRTPNNFSRQCLTWPLDERLLFLACVLTNKDYSKSYVKLAELALKNKSELLNMKVAGRTALQLAVLAENLPLIDFLIEKGASLEEVAGDNFTPFDLAMKAMKCEELVKQFILSMMKKSKYNHFVLSENPEMPNDYLRAAACIGNVSIFTALLKKKKNRLKKEFLEELLHYMVLNDNGSLAGEFLTMTDHFKKKHLENNYNSLAYVALSKGHIEVVDFLKSLNEKGQRDWVNDEINKVGDTPLHVLAENGHYELAQKLLERGAEYKKNNEGHTPLNSACKAGDTKLVELLLETQALNLERNYGSPFLNACALNECAAVEFLIKQNYNVLKTCDIETGDSAFHIAVRNCAPELLELLLSKSADFSLKNFKEKMLGVACENNFFKGIEILLTDAQPCAFEEKDYFSFLKNSLVEERDRAYFLACVLGEKEVIDYFHTQVFTNASEFNDEAPLDGNTALHIAAYYGHLELCDFLVRKKFDVQKVNGSGHTPIDLSYQRLSDLESKYHDEPHLHAKKAKRINSSRDNTHNTALILLKKMLEKFNRPSFFDNNDSALTRGFRAACALGVDPAMNYYRKKTELINECGSQGLIDALNYNSDACIPTIKDLLDAGADPLKEVNKTGQSFFGYVVNAKRSDLCKLILDYIRPEGIDKGKYLHIVAAGGVPNPEKVLPLVLQSCLINEKIKVLGKEYEYTPLLFAVGKKNPHLCKVLIENGAQASGRQNSEIYFAMYNDDVKVLEVLWNSATNKKTIGKCLNFALRKNCEKVVRWLLDKANESDLKEKDQRGNTPLHNACLKDKLDICQLLIKKGASLKEKNKNNETPVKCAVMSNKQSIAFMLMEEEMTQVFTEKNRESSFPQWMNISQMSLLQKACALGNTDFVEFLLKQNPEKINEIDSDNCTLLHYAVFSQNEHLCKLIFECIKTGHQYYELLRPSLLDSVGSPLDYVCALDKDQAPCQISLCEMLLRYHPNWKAYSWCNRGLSNFNNALHFACENNYASAVKLILDDSKDDLNSQDCTGSTPLVTALKHKNYQLAEYLIEQGADCERADNSHKTPLYLACEEKEALKVCQMILDKKVAINTQTYENETALLKSIRHNAPEIFALLVRNGAEVTVQVAGVSPLGVALKYNYKQILDIIGGYLKNRCTLKDEIIGPIHYASFFGFYDIIEQCADQVNEQTKNKIFSPLHFACAHNQKIVCEKLINLGAQVNAGDITNTTPWMLACKKSNFEAFEYLLGVEGITLNATDTHGNTVWHFACEKSDDGKFAQLLLDKNILVNRWLSFEKIVPKGGKSVSQRAVNSTYLHEICSSGMPLSVVQNLLEKENLQHLMHKDELGYTPVHRACQFGRLDIITLFLNRFREQIVWNEENEYGETPLYIAVDNEQIDIVNELLKSDLDVGLHRENKEGWAPLTRAFETGNVPLAKRLLEAHSINQDHAYLKSFMTSLTALAREGHLLDDNASNQETLSSLLAKHGLLYSPDDNYSENASTVGSSAPSFWKTVYIQANPESLPDSASDVSGPFNNIPLIKDDNNESVGNFSSEKGASLASNGFVIGENASSGVSNGTRDTLSNSLQIENNHKLLLQDEYDESVMNFSSQEKDSTGGITLTEEIGTSGSSSGINDYQTKSLQFTNEDSGKYYDSFLD